MKDKDIKRIETVEQLARLTQLEFLEAGGQMGRLEKEDGSRIQIGRRRSAPDPRRRARYEERPGSPDSTLANLEESVRYLDKRVSRLEGKAGRQA